jgi:acetate---CoA ligase (ADP-forming)
VSIGNKPDVSSNDLIQYWEDDPNTKVIALYLESFGNPRKFSRIARRITRNKPMLVVKGARTHMGAVVSEKRSPVRDLVVRALFRQAGIIRVDTLQELFDTAALLTFAPLPKGNRVAVLTNTAGGAVITVDALLTEGLHFVEPVIDLGSDALAEGYRRTLPAILRDESVDSVIVIFVPAGLSEQEDVLNAIRDAILEVAAEGICKPVIANFLTKGDYLVRFLDAGEQRVPVYPFPEQAVHALARVTEYSAYRSRPQGRVVDLNGFDGEEARYIVRNGVRSERTALDSDEVVSLCSALGVPLSSVEDLKLESYLYRVAVRIEQDPLFGPLIHLRLLRRPVPESRWWDVPDILSAPHVIRITPLTDLDSKEMVETVLGDVLPPGNESYFRALEELLLRLSRLAEEVHEVESVWISEIVLRKGGCYVPQDAVTVTVKQIEARS